ncbi:MAG: hypothetical protein AAFY27_03360 [Pseudomonadota bacterium]
MKHTFKVLAASALFAVSSTAAGAEDAPVSIKAVGTWGNLTNFKQHEGPFWNQTIAQASGVRSSAISNRRPNLVSKASRSCVS